MTVKNNIPGCTCNCGHDPHFPNLGGYARCPIHDPNMQEPDPLPTIQKDLNPTPISQQDKDDDYVNSDRYIPMTSTEDPEFTWQSLRNKVREAHKAERILQSIVATQQATIEELVKGLERVKRCCEAAALEDRVIVDIHKGVTPLINKHRKPC